VEATSEHAAMAAESGQREEPDEASILPTASATAAVPFGCGKCRWSPGGCTRCRADGFVPGPREGRAGGIPQPGSVESSLVVGSLGDAGGLRIPAIVTDDTPICNALRSAGLAAGLGMISQVRVKAGEAVMEYCGEVLTRDQAAAREAWYAEQQLSCSYHLFTEQHGYVIDATLYGNAARFMNASCEPNLKPSKMAHEDSLPRVLFTATRDIQPGEELTWRYHAASSTAKADQSENEYAKERRSYGGRRHSAQDHAGRRTSQLATSFGFTAHPCFCGSTKCTTLL